MFAFDAGRAFKCPQHIECILSYVNTDIGDICSCVLIIFNQGLYIIFGVELLFQSCSVNPGALFV